MGIELCFGIGGLGKEGAKSKVGEAWCGVILTTIGRLWEECRVQHKTALQSGIFSD